MHFQDLRKRCIISFVSLALLLSILLFSYVEIIKWIVVLCAVGSGSIGIWEYGRLANLTEKRGLVALCIAIGALMIVAFFLSTFDYIPPCLPFIALFLGTIALFFYHFKYISSAITSIAKSFFGICYVSLPIGLILNILYLGASCVAKGDGRIWILYLIVVTMTADIGAYLGGSLFGSRKLSPSLSPGKTVMGAVSGFVVALVFSLLFYLAFHFTGRFSLSWVESLYLGAVLGVLGQVGDLCESLLKRCAGTKDSNCLPGLGGILDMLDSLLFTTPAIYFFLYAC